MVSFKHLRSDLESTFLLRQSLGGLVALVVAVVDVFVVAAIVVIAFALVVVVAAFADIILLLLQLLAEN